MKQTILLLLSACTFFIASAQFSINCDGLDKHAIYFNNMDGDIYRIDSVDIAPSDAKLVTNVPFSSFYGISINKDLNGGSGLQKLYVSTGLYHYWNDTGWVHTQHNSGNANPGGSNNYIYDLDGVNGKVYRYDGTGNATVLLQNLGTKDKVAYDVACDHAGNFYIFYVGLNKIVAFTEAGAPIDTFTTSNGGMVGTSAPGFAIVGERIYTIDQANNLYEGILSGKNVTFTMIKATGITGISDLAACSSAGTVLAIAPQPELPRFAVYPNPARSNVRIAMANAEAIQVFDYLGQQKLQLHTAHATEYTFSVEGWSAGIYLVTATGANGQQVQQKLVMQ